jgi:Cu(I)/Ag(I) efflux system membrane fusion protein
MKKKWNMNTKKIFREILLYANTLLCVISIALLLSSCNSKKTNQDAKKSSYKYTCPMHPEIVRDHPGQCPICGMDLVKQMSQDTNSIHDNLPNQKSKNTSIYLGLKSIHPEFSSKEISHYADGFIAYDTRTFKNITARFSGRIEKSYVRYVFQNINIGDKLFEVYSPEIETASQEYLYSITHSPAEKKLLDAGRQKLLLLGVSMDDLTEIEKTKNIKQTVTIYSEYSGHVHEMIENKDIIPENTQMNKTYTDPILTITEGSYIKKGQVLLNVVNPHNVWAVLKVYEDDISFIHLHQDLRLLVDEDSTKVFQGKVDFIQPFYEGESKGITIRVYLTNTSHQFKVGMLLKAIIKGDAKRGIWIPKTAVLDLGRNKIVFIKRNESFEARKINTGLQSDTWIEIKKGVVPMDEIAANAQYLVDSESLIKIKDEQ